ncbi:MAG: SET domain-containing protein [Xanthobacteraceae bacterium]|nr:SET domain-containing protein [Xanthobacteraceae bacterium]QYK46118.1 MAG: SET domain-containing protein [Xanthobacteraceae bacterium]
MPKHPFRIGRSVTGLGLFATETIKKGQRVVEYTGRRLTTKQAEWIEDNTENRYVFELNDKVSIDGSSRSNYARYVNHSCRPNCESYQYAMKIFYRAKWTIHPGQELTVSYGQDYFDSFIKPIGCKCPTCIARRKRERMEARAKAARKKKRALNGKHKNGKSRNGKAR